MVLNLKAITPYTSTCIPFIKEMKKKFFNNDSICVHENDKILKN